MPPSCQTPEYKKLGEEAFQEAWDTINSSGWRLDKQIHNGDTVHVKEVKGKKVFKLTGLVDIPPKLLLDQLWTHIELVPSWNPTLDLCSTIQVVDSHTDVSYQVAAEAAGGLVSTRDFVNLRHWGEAEGGVLVSAGKSIRHPAMKDQDKRIRGDNGPGCWVMRPVQGRWDQCTFQWLLDTDLKGWIPQAIVDKALSGSQFDFIENIRARARQLKEEGLFEEYKEEEGEEENEDSVTEDAER